MGKLITSNRKFGVRNRTIASDANGIGCCCSACCTTTDPNALCVRVDQSNGRSWPSPIGDIGEYQHCLACIRFRRKKTGVALLNATLTYRYDGTSTSPGRSSVHSISIGLTASGAVCYDQGGMFGAITDGYIEGAVYDNLVTTAPGFRYVREFVRTGTSRDAPRVVPEVSTLNMPLITDEVYRNNQRETWVGFGEVTMFQPWTPPDTSNDWTTWTRNPIYARHYFFNTTAFSEFGSEGHHCRCVRSYSRNVGCPNNVPGTGTESFNMTIADDGVRGSVSLVSSSSRNCRPDRDSTLSETTSMNYRVDWVRQPCPCLETVAITDRPEEREREVVAPDLL